MKPISKYLFLTLTAVFLIVDLCLVYMISTDLFGTFFMNCDGFGCHWGAEPLGWLWSSPGLYLFVGITIILSIIVSIVLSVTGIIKEQYSKALMGSMLPLGLLFIMLFIFIVF